MEDKNIQDVETEQSAAALEEEDVDAIFGECDEEDVKWTMSSEELDALASEILSVASGEIKNCCREVNESGLRYYWSRTRGGLHMLIDPTGEKLVAGSAISFDTLLAEFEGGRRN